MAASAESMKKTTSTKPASRGTKRSPYILAIDVGYSSVKAAYGEAGKRPTQLLRPANAGLKRLMPVSLSGIPDPDGTIVRVTLEDEEWVAFPKPGVLQATARPLFSDYPFTPEYLVLFYGALINTGRDVIDLVVTGLPVDQSQNPDVVEKLKARLKGKHKITPKKTVEVKDVKIVAQPTGTYIHAIDSLRKDAVCQSIMASGRVAVLDPGMFSTDWVLIQENALRAASSGTSHQAMSVVYEGIHNEIADKYGVGPGPQKIERAIQEGQTRVMVSGEWVDIAPMMSRVGGRVAGVALAEMRRDLRIDTEGGIDMFVITGGGAPVFKPVAEAAFPACKRVWVPESAQMANALGYWGLANVTIR